jgi:hypothetical protein
MRPIHSIQVPQGPLLAVTDLPAAYRTHQRYDVVISLLDPGTELDWQHPRHHIFWVDDVEHVWRSVPDAAFVDALLGVDLAGASEVLIHCHGGYSRSPAAVMLWASKLGTSLRTIELGIDWTQADPQPPDSGAGRDPPRSGTTPEGYRTTEDRTQGTRVYARSWVRRGIRGSNGSGH